MSIERPNQLIFIRHAESARNKAKGKNIYFPDEETRDSVRGIADHEVSLTERGVEQARRTGQYLLQRFGVPDYFYHSGYKRTQDTTSHILEAFSAKQRAHVQVRMNQFIRERNPGFTYEMTTEEARQAFPYLQRHWETLGGYFAEPPGGESLAQVSDRVYTFLSMLFRDRRGKKVWATIHGGTLRSVRFLLERWTYDQALKWPKGEAPKNCGITVYDYNEEKGHLVLQEYNTVCEDAVNIRK